MYIKLKLFSIYMYLLYLSAPASAFLLCLLLLPPSFFYYLSFFASALLYFCFSLYPSVFIFLPVSFYISTSVYPSVFIFLPPSFCISASASDFLLCLSASLSVLLYVSLLPFTDSQKHFMLILTFISVLMFFRGVLEASTS